LAPPTRALACTRTARCEIFCRASSGGERGVGGDGGGFFPGARPAGVFGFARALSKLADVAV
jgi:hypothetical protein